MGDILAATAAGAGGLLVGICFFGGLWWTVHRGLLCRRSGTIFLGSVILRYSLALLAFYIIIVSGSWLTRLVPCMLGFMISRWIVKRLTGHMAFAPTVGEGGETCT